jgi:S1-C subfamily serine protease
MELGPGGVKVMTVKDGSIVAKAGLKPNDVLIRLDVYVTKTVEDVHAAKSKYVGKDSIVAEVMREQKPLFLRLYLK